MSISLEETKHIARLAKLSFSEEEFSQLAKELEAIVGYVEKLKTLDIDDVTATSHVLDLNNVFREDKASEALPIEEVLRNAPAKKMGYYSVPKVIG